MESHDDKKISGSGQYDLDNLPLDEFDMVDDYDDGSLATSDTT